MRCPHCGKEIIASTVNYTGMLQKLIMDRLTEYGYEEICPKKYRVYSAVRNTLQILVPDDGWNTGNRIISEELYYKAESKLNEIMPSKKEAV